MSLFSKKWSVPLNEMALYTGLKKYLIFDIFFEYLINFLMFEVLLTSQMVHSPLEMFFDQLCCTAISMEEHRNINNLSQSQQYVIYNVRFIRNKLQQR